MFTTKNLLLLIGRHLLIALGAVFVASLAVWFLSSEIERISDDAVKNRQLASTLEKRTELLATLKRDAAIVGENDTLIKQAFVPADNILGFVSVLKKLALRNAVMQTFHFGTPAPSSIPAPFALSAIPYSNTLSGTIFTFSHYLKEFENLPYFTTIQSLTISSQDKTLGWRGASGATMSATLYAQTAQ